MAAVECQKCHRFASSGHNFCSYCGTSLTSSRALPNPKENYPAARYAPYKPVKEAKKSSGLGALLLGATAFLVLKDWRKPDE